MGGTYTAASDPKKNVSLSFNFLDFLLLVKLKI